jgi:hypothetical protein
MRREINSQELRDDWTMAVDDRERVGVASWRRKIPGKTSQQRAPRGVAEASDIGGDRSY